jgi:DNA polymerase-3 subunit beta
MAITIPAKAIHELIKVIEKQRPPTVTCGIDAVQIAFFLEGLQVIARAIDSAYPRYHQLIPDRFKGTVTLERSSFLSALERVAIVASQKNDIIKLEVPPLETPSPMFLRAEVADVGGGVEALDVEVAGSGGVDIGINGKYLAEALKAIKADKVTFNFNTPASPVVIFPVSGGADLVSTHLLMPVQLRGDK